MNSENPYASPVDPRAGEYDHSLWWAFVKAASLLALLFLFTDAIAITKYIQVANPSRPLAAVVWGFFADWKSGSAPTWPADQAATKGQLP